MWSFKYICVCVSVFRLNFWLIDLNWNDLNLFAFELIKNFTSTNIYMLKSNILGITVQNFEFII